MKKKLSSMILLSAMAVLVMAAGTQTIKAQTNYFTNPGFESGLTGWGVYDNTNQLTSDTTSPHSGTMDAKLVCGSSGKSQISQTIQCSALTDLANKPILISFWYKGTFAKSAACLEVDWALDDSSGNILQWQPSVVTNTGSTSQWTQAFYYLYYVPPTAADHLTITFTVDNGSAGDVVYFDDMSFTVNTTNPNLVNNGGFETGGLANWTLWQAPANGGSLAATVVKNSSQAEEGSYYCDCTWGDTYTAARICNSWNSFGQLYSTPTPFRWTAWVITKSVYDSTSPADTVDLMRNILDSKSNTVTGYYNSSYGMMGTSNTWKQLQSDFEWPAGTAQELWLCLDAAASGDGHGECYWDNMVLNPLPPIDATTGNLLANGSFESGTSQWMPWTNDASMVSCSTVNDASGAKDGQNYLKLQALVNNAPSVEVLQDLYTLGGRGLTSSQTLTLSAWYKADFGATDQVVLAYAYLNLGLSAKNNQINVVATATGSQSTWTQLSAQFPFVADPNYPVMRVFLTTSASFVPAGQKVKPLSGNMTVYYDDASLELSSVTTPTPTPTQVNAVHDWSLY